MPCIYLLSDPTTGAVRYVGKADNAQRRFDAHIYYAQRGYSGAHKDSWIRKLARSSAEPVLSVLFDVPDGASWQVAERFFIASAKHFGFELTNMTAGGESAAWEDEEWREKNIEALRSAWARPEVRAKHEAVWTDEFSAKWSDMQREINSRPGMREQKSAAVKVKKGTPEAKAAARAKRLAHLSKPGVREAIAERTRARWADPEHRVKVRAAQIRRWAERKILSAAT